MTEAERPELTPDGDSARASEPASEHDEMRALYRSLTPPPLADSLEELERTDPEAAGAVRWMQSAWRGLEIPEPRARPFVLRPQPVAPRAAPRSARFTRLARLAAAALFLALLGAGAWQALARRRTGRPAPAPSVAATPASGASAAIEVLDVRPDQIELRSGPVRLVLLTPSIPETADTAAQDRPQ